MINKTNIDVQIYVDKLMEGINQLGLIESISVEWGIENKEYFQESLIENITIQASINFEENGNPVLDESQFESVLVKSATECTVEEMVEQGVLIKELGDETENVYRINPNIETDEEDDDNE